MNKITVLRTDVDERGVKVHRVLYWYTVASPIMDASTPPAKVVPQRDTEIPVEANGYVQAADRTAVNAGDAGFEVHFRQQTTGETNNAFRTRILADHAGCETSWLAQKRAQFAFAGLGVN